VLFVLSPIRTILRNISSPRFPLSFSHSLLSFAGTRFIVVANGPSSWRHGRGDGIKSRRAARDLLIVATESSRRYPPWRRTPPSTRDSLRSSSSLFLRPPPSYVTRVHDGFIFFFYRPRAHSRTVQLGPARFQQLLFPYTLPPHPNTMHIPGPLFPHLVVVHLVFLLRSPAVSHSTYLTPSPWLPRLLKSGLRQATLLSLFIKLFPEVLIAQKERNLSSPLVDLDSGKTKEFRQKSYPFRRKIHQPLLHRLSHAASVVCPDKRTDCSSCDLCLTALHGEQLEKKYISDNSFALSFPLALYYSSSFHRE